MSRNQKVEQIRNQHPDAYGDYKLRASNYRQVTVVREYEEWKSLIRMMQVCAVDAPGYTECAEWVHHCEALMEQVK